MSYASPVDVAVNPNNSAQRFILWGNGRVDNIGGAPPITSGPQWMDRLDQPVGWALHITNWATGAGYVLDFAGGFQPLNGAPDLMIDHDANNETPERVPGVPYVDHRRYVDWSWDPSGNGQGYVLDAYGQLYPFGGASAPTRSGPRWTAPVARKLVMQWSPDKRALTLDRLGGVHRDWAAPAFSGGPYWPGQDVARDLVVTNWTSGQGYVLDLYGAGHSLGGAPKMSGVPWSPGRDAARALYVLSAANPSRFWQVHSGGQSYEYVSSTPPTVTAGGVAGSPPATVTTTTRPALTWSFSDQQRDEQTAWEVLVFTQAFVGLHNMTNPAQWSADAIAVLSGVDRTQRGVIVDFDFPNGSYRYYVRAKDAADQWSAWSNRGWTQNVAAPATPTVMTAVVDPDSYAVALSVKATTGGTADSIRFEYSDDGVSWEPVRGAEAVPLAATTSAIDWDAPFGVTRNYRAVAFNDVPRVVSAPSATVPARLDAVIHVLTSTADPALGGRILVVPGISWSRPVKAGVFEAIGAEFPTVVSDGAPKARKLTLQLTSLNRSMWEMIEALVESDSTLVYRDPHGDVAYVRVVGDFGRAQLKGAALRHEHSTEISLVEVAPPTTVAYSSMPGAA